MGRPQPDMIKHHDAEGHESGTPLDQKKEGSNGSGELVEETWANI
jgi:hypothetical protein